MPSGTLWLSGRYNRIVYAINTTNGHLIGKIAVGNGPQAYVSTPSPDATRSDTPASSANATPTPTCRRP